MTSSAPRRRWFRYSLRTLLALMTLFCVWLGVQVKWSRDRHEALAHEHVCRIGLCYRPAPWSIRILGERGYEQLFIYHVAASDARHAKVMESLFPEARVELETLPAVLVD